MAMLEVTSLGISFGGLRAVDELSMKIEKGGLVGLIGPNGAGKTTAFNVITGVYQPTNGQALFHDKVYLRNHPQGKMKKGYKGENGLLYTSEYKLEGQKTKEEEINERDERNIALHNAAMATAFEVMNLFFGIGLVALAMLGYMNRVSFFTLIILYLLSNAIYVLRLRRLEKEF